MMRIAVQIFLLWIISHTEDLLVGAQESTTQTSNNSTEINSGILVETQFGDDSCGENFINSIEASQLGVCSYNIITEGFSLLTIIYTDSTKLSLRTSYFEDLNCSVTSEEPFYTDLPTACTYTGEISKIYRYQTNETADVPSTPALIKRFAFINIFFPVHSN